MTDETKTKGMSLKFELWMRRFVVLVVVVGILIAEIWADPGQEKKPIDRIFHWAFVAFVVGLVELFVLFIGLAVLGRIDLPGVFQDKDGQLAPKPTDSNEPQYVQAVAGQGSVSLSRLQAFLWTLVIMIIYFHKAVIAGSDDLPTMPSELLLVMGISGAVYLASKDITVRDAKNINTKGSGTPPPPPPGGAQPAHGAAQAPLVGAQAGGAQQGGEPPPGPDVHP